VAKRVVVGAVVLGLGVGFAGGWLAHQAPSPLRPVRPHIVSVLVPNVVGKSTGVAMAVVRHVGLSPVLGPVPPGAHVVNQVGVQVPAAGTSVPAGATVEIIPRAVQYG
jgi:PASTA domain